MYTFHHLRDANKQVSCTIGAKSENEQFAERFAVAILMPLNELRAQVKRRSKGNRYISMDAVLEIADYFGVSFQSWCFRIAYRVHAISGNTEAKELQRRATKYAPDKKRKQLKRNMA